MTRSAIDHRLRAGSLAAASRGVYLIGEPSYLQSVSALVQRVGVGAAASHRTAARLHGLDGFRECEVVEVVTAHHSGLRSADVHRSRVLSSDDIVQVHGLPVTSIARTIRDLGAVVGMDDVELALEHALRSKDPGDPDGWDRSLLAALSELAGKRTPRTGAATLARVLARRPSGTRPTGSFAETKGVQALRPAGHGDLVRQADVRIFDASGRLLHHLYPDFLELGTGAITEINGTAHRGGTVMTPADVARINLLAAYLPVLVYPAATVLHAPATFASEVRRRIASEPIRADVEHRNGATILRRPTGFDVHLP